MSDTIGGVNNIQQEYLDKLDSDADFFELLHTLFKEQDEFCIQGIVRAYDPKTNIAEVEPIPKQKIYKEDGTYEEKVRQRVKVRVMNIARGGFVIHIPVFVGDTGWLIAADRSAEAAMKKNANILKDNQTDADFGSNNPEKNTGAYSIDDDEVCRYGFGMFIPDSWSKLNTDLVPDPRKLIISSTDGKNRIEIGGEDKIVVNGMKEQEIDFVVKVYYDQGGHAVNYDVLTVKGLFEKVGEPKKQNVFNATPLSVEIPSGE